MVGVLMGLQYKVAHKRADNGKWSAKTPTQRNYFIRFLKEHCPKEDNHQVAADTSLFRFNAHNSAAMQHA